MQPTNLRRFFYVAGAVWLCVGTALLTLGIHFLTTWQQNPVVPSHLFSFIPFFERCFSSNALLFLLISSLLLGYSKGRWVLRRTALRHMRYFSSLERPSWARLYGPSSLLLIGIMMTLGMLLRWIPISLDVRGAVDVAIGAALIQGSLHYFRFRSHL